MHIFSHLHIHNNKQILVHTTHNKCQFLYRIVGLLFRENKSKLIYPTLCPYFNTTLIGELNPNFFFLQILEVPTQFLHHTVHIVTALIVLVHFLQYCSSYLPVYFVYFTFLSQRNHCINYRALICSTKYNF